MVEEYQTREIEALLYQRLTEFPIVMLEGARQVGKSTLVRNLQVDRSISYRTLDDLHYLEDAKNNPMEFLGPSAKADHLVIVDEIQKAPDLLNAVKYYVDKYKRKGMFLLTGSADPYHLQHKQETLSGRVCTLALHPFSQLEIDKINNVNFIEGLYNGISPPARDCSELVTRVHLGGYPEVIIRDAKPNLWLNNYLQAEIFKIISEATRSEAVTAIPAVLRRLAKHTGLISNIKGLSTELPHSEQVVSRLLNKLGNIFIYDPLPSLHVGKPRVAKKSKIYLNDSGLACALLNLDQTELKKNERWGQLLETFVLAELRKHLAVSGLSPFADVFFYRQDRGGLEVDFVISNGVDGDLVAIEIKGAETITYSDYRNLIDFKRLVGKKCKRTIIMYSGNKKETLNEEVEAWPLSCLWSWQDQDMLI